MGLPGSREGPLEINGDKFHVSPVVMVVGFSTMFSGKEAGME